MDKPFTVKGYWFLPNQEEQKIAGILTYEPGENIRLELFGSLSGNSLSNFFEDVDWNESRIVPLIYGYTSDGKFYSLIDSFKGKSSRSFNAEFPLTSFIVNTAINGLHIENRDEKIFVKIQVSYNLFQEWLGLSGFERLETDVGTSVAISYKYPDIISFPINSDYNLRFTFHYDYIRNSRFECIIKQSSFVEIQSNIPVSYRSLGEQIFLFQDFLSMATLSTIENESAKVYLDNLENETLTRPISFFELFLKRDILSTKKPKDSHKFLFEYHSISSTLPDIVQKWFRNKADLTPIRRFIVESNREISLFQSNHFLNITQSLEGFHRRFRNNKQKGLKLRLKEIYNEFSDIQLIVSEFSDLENITSSVEDSRHYYSHLFKLEMNSTKDGKELYELTKKLRILLICCVLKEMGFTNSMINNILVPGKM